MVHFNTKLFALTLGVAVSQGAPHVKRIAQVIADSTAKWEEACVAAGGAQQCNQISVTAFTTLLAAAGPCEQQDSADAMIDLAKSLNADADMIKFAQLFAQQPRNTPNLLSVPYCQTAPKNAELDGLFQCQFEGADPTTFVGGLAAGDTGTVPFGQNAPLDPAGSCKANAGGPITDGAQLTDITEDPGVNGGSASSAGSKGNDDNAGAAAGNAGDTSGDDSEGGASPGGASTGAKAGSDTLSAASTGAAAGSTPGSGFLLQNGQDAQAKNAQFASLTENSPCQDGETACVNDGFAQCVGGSFTVTACSGGLICAALPLVNAAGTSVTCTTQADAQARIAATGATGGISG